MVQHLSLILPLTHSPHERNGLEVSNFFFKLLILSVLFATGCRIVSNNGSGSGLTPAQNILTVQVWFGFIDLKFNCRYSFRPDKLKEKLLMITTALILRVPAPVASGYGKIYSYFC